MGDRCGADFNPQYSLLPVPARLIIIKIIIIIIISISVYRHKVVISEAQYG